eukprot:1628851-Ditylum_brightwellii.AAC.1
MDEAILCSKPCWNPKDMPNLGIHLGQKQLWDAVTDDALEVCADNMWIKISLFELKVDWIWAVSGPKN